MIYKVILLFLLSTFKFAIAIPPIVFYFSYIEALMVSLGGGLFGVFFFRYIWRWVLVFWDKYIARKQYMEEKPVKITKRKRTIVNMKNKYGYWGVLILTPVFLSIPIGVLLLQRYFKFKKYKYLTLSALIVIWGFLIVSFFHFIYYNNYLGL